MPTRAEIDRFVAAYKAALFWAETDDAGEPLDQELSPSALDAESEAAVLGECLAFCLAMESLIETWAGPGDAYEQAGHDFLLTRNRHGCGFWESEWGNAGEALTAAAHAVGETYAETYEDASGATRVRVWPLAEVGVA
jgi:hypothetical protein